MKNTESNSLKNNNRCNSIDGLRTIACIGIALMHVRANCSYAIGSAVYNTIIPAFTNFVFLFMMISAFGVCCGYFERMSKGEITPAAFYERRYMKVLPFFAVVCILDFAMGPGLNTLLELAADLTLVFGLLPNGDISVIGVGWFLGTVFVFYMLFPFFCFIMKTKKRAWLAFAISVFYNFACIWYFFDSNHMIEGTGGRAQFIYSAMFFMAGCLVYLYKDSLAKFVKKFRWLMLIICAAFTAAYFLVHINSFVTNICMLLMFESYLIYAAGVDSKLLYNPVTKFVSGISMEIYLCHMVVFRVAEKLGLNYIFGDGWLSYALTCVIVLAGSIVFSLCVKYALKLIGKISGKIKIKLSAA
ncbi:MAG: acyltransferase [Clostridia bacterium]|nr:acyltransferase [Clostridia bacterium]